MTEPVWDRRESVIADAKEHQNDNADNGGNDSFVTAALFFGVRLSVSASSSYFDKSAPAKRGAMNFSVTNVPTKERCRKQQGSNN